MKVKKCQECGKEFKPTNGFQKYCAGPHSSICVICGKEFKYTCRPSEKPKTCSRKCQTELQHQTVKVKYGVDNVSQILGIYDIPKHVAKSQKIRICSWCGEEFKGYGTAKYCNRIHYADCVICGQNFVVDPRQPKKTCSSTCKQRLIQNSWLPKLKFVKNAEKSFTQQVVCLNIVPDHIINLVRYAVNL